MKKQSTSVVSSVTAFITGTRLYGKPRPSTLELMLEARKLHRHAKDLRASIEGKPKRGAVASIFISSWDLLMAYIMTILLISLRITLFLFFWALLIMAIPMIIQNL